MSCGRCPRRDRCPRTWPPGSTPGWPTWSRSAARWTAPVDGTVDGPVDGADELAARRRRRRLATGLVAAASVAVIGIGLGTVAELTGSGNDALTSGSAVSDDAGAGAAAESPEVRPEMAPEMAPESAPGDATGESDGGAAPEGPRFLSTPRQDVSSATLERDVTRVAGRAEPRTAREGVAGDRILTEADPRGRAALRPCAVPSAGPGDLLAPVRLDGDPATLVLRSATDGTQVARIYACGDADSLLASTTVPGR